MLFRSSVMKIKLFLMCLSLFLEKFNFYYTFQGTKYANGICSFYTIFNILFCFKNPFMHPVCSLSLGFPSRKEVSNLGNISPNGLLVLSRRSHLFLWALGTPNVGRSSSLIGSGGEYQRSGNAGCNNRTRRDEDLLWSKDRSVLTIG